MIQPKFSLNRIIQPHLSLIDFIQLSTDCQASGIEIRNDLTDPRLLGGNIPEKIRNKCDECGIEIVTVNALQRFNDHHLLDDKIVELEAMMKTAALVGCRNIVLCPVNDSKDNRSTSKQQRDLVLALDTYAPLFEKYEMTGLIEPLGFEICSVRYKRQAVEAISESTSPQLYQIVHDTFHHYLSGETEIFPKETGLVHASGVSTGKTINAITDNDRILVDERDIVDNRGQIALLYEAGFDGIFSFEPFSPTIQNLPINELKSGISTSMKFIFR